jgi:PAS domain S-box-containing protein
MWGRLNISSVNHRGNPLVIATVEDITEIRAAEEELFHYAAIVESSEDAIISKNLDGVILTWNAAAQHIFGYTGAEVVGRPLTFLAPPERQHEESEIFQKLKAGERVEHYETVRVTKAGKRIHVSLSLSPTKDCSGRVIGVSKIVRDITQSKLADEVLSKMSQKLIEAREQESSRLARELHDDVNQRLALVMIRLESLNEDPPASAEQLKTHIGKLVEELADLGQDVQALSHRLHSPKLELLGLEVAASSFCKEFSNRQHVEIDFESTNVPKNLEEPISLCLYRVLQEALQNAAKHSGSHRFRVSLSGGTEEIKLTVHDSGVGFELNEVLKGRGLGLISMRERLKLVGGELSIDSEPHQGTTIQARVPLTQKTWQERLN